MIKRKRIRTLALFAVFGLLAATMLLSNAQAQTTLAKWTFETLTLSSTYTNAPGVVTNVTPEIGAGVASGFHSFTGSSQFSTPVGNGSSKSLSANVWTNVNGGDYWQFKVSTVGNQNIVVTWDQFGSGTGPRDFSFQYSTDGVNFTEVNTYTVLGSPSWSSTTPTTATSYTNDLSSILSLNNAATVYFRLVCVSSVSINGTTVGSGGTDRVDNFAVVANNPGPLTFTKDLSNTNTYFGDSLTLSVAATGTTPISYQWFFPNLSSPLGDGITPSGGTISGATSPTLNLSYISTNQAGNYQVIVSNPDGSITSLVAQVTVAVRPTIATNIAYLRTLRTTNFVLGDTTNLYQVEGIVTTPINLVSSPGKSFFLQDATGGLDIFFRNSDFQFPNSGDRVRVTAQLEDFNGLLELHAVVTNQTHKIEILDSGNPLPTPQLFNFTTQFNPTNMEFFVEGSYVVASNVYITVTNADGHLVAGGTVLLTNLAGQGFRLSIPSNPLAEPVGNLLPDSPASAPFTIFASAVKGVMTQIDSSSVRTNGYAIILSDRADITVGTPPPPSVSLSVRQVGTSVEISWPTSASGFNLETTTTLTSPSWTSAGSPTVVGSSNVVTISSPTGNAFYRLHQ